MTPAQTAIIVQRTVEGVPGCMIAQTMGVHPSTITRTQQKPDIKAYIEAEGQRIITGGLHIARKVILRRAAEGLVKQADDATKDRSLKASVHITNMAGLSGNNPSTVINQLIYSNSTHAQDTPESLVMLQRALGIEHNDDVIDLSTGLSTDKHELSTGR